MASLTGKSGKCSNFGNCSLADARTAIAVSTGQDFVCTECGKPLLLTDAGPQAGGSAKALTMGAMVLALLLAIGMGWWLMSGKKAPEPPAPAVVIEQPQAPPQPPQPPPRAEAPASPVPVTGDCSQADASAGLCRRPTP